MIDILGRMLCISRNVESLPEEGEEDDEDDDDDDSCLKSDFVKSLWMTMARVLDRLFFLVYCLTFFIMAIVFTCI